LIPSPIHGILCILRGNPGEKKEPGARTFLYSLL